jgi:hypothetical protein
VRKRWTAIVTAAGLGLGACGSTPPIVIDPAPYAGPSMSFEAGARDHVAVFTMPTGGWGLRFDRVRDGFEAQQVFVTLAPPSSGSGGAATPAVVEQRVATRVRLGRGVEVFARIAEKDQPPGGYRFVARERAK